MVWDSIFINTVLNEPWLEGEGVKRKKKCRWPDNGVPMLLPGFDQICPRSYSSSPPSICSCASLPKAPQ